MHANAKENLLRGTYFENTNYIPKTNEDILVSFQFEGNFKMENWTDKWGVDWKTTHPDDLEFTAEHTKLLPDTNRNNHLVCGSLTSFLFERAWALTGMDNFLKSFFTHPREMREFLGAIADFNMKVFERCLETNVDLVTFSEDIGHQRGLMISPIFFREFFVPQHNRCLESLVNEGKIVDS